MSIDSTSSITSYLQTAQNFFSSLASSGTSESLQQSPIENLKVKSGFSFDDLLSTVAKSNSGEDVLLGLGQKAEGYVMNEFGDQLKQEVADATANPTKGGFFSGIYRWIGDSSFGKMLLGDTVAPAVGSEVGVVEGAGTGGTAASVLAGITSGYDLIKNFGTLSPAHGALSGMTLGASIGSIVPGVGTVIGGLIGAVGGGLLSLFHNSGKDKDQKARDMMRKGLQQSGIIDDKFTIGLADGTRYDIGVDGKPKKEFNGLHPFDVDLKNPLAVKMASYFGPLTMVACGGNQKLASDLCGYLTNAALSNAGGDESKAKENAIAIFSQFKMGPEEILKGVSGLTQQGALQTQQAEVYVNSLKDLFSSVTA